MDDPTQARLPERTSRREAGHHLWRLLTMPWFSVLLSQASLCRALAAGVLLLGGAHLLGWSLWPCMFATITGLPCPGCGMTRSVAALLRGQWHLAMGFHPFSPGFLVLGALLFTSALAPRLWRDRLVRYVELVERRTFLPLIFLACAFIYGLLRMGGFATSPPIVSPPPVRAWLQERIRGG